MGEYRSYRVETERATRSEAIAKRRFEGNSQGRGTELYKDLLKVQRGLASIYTCAVRSRNEREMTSFLDLSHFTRLSDHLPDSLVVSL